MPATRTGEGARMKLGFAYPHLFIFREAIIRSFQMKVSLGMRVVQRQRFVRRRRPLRLAPPSHRPVGPECSAQVLPSHKKEVGPS
jgi:hypothetical protein